MMDIVQKRGDIIDTKKLAKALGCPVVATSAVKESGLSELMEAVASVSAPPAVQKFSRPVEDAVSDISGIIEKKHIRGSGFHTLYRAEAV